jgi:hypothetical protein
VGLKSPSFMEPFEALNLLIQENYDVKRLSHDL